MFIRDCELQDIEKWVELNLEFMKYEIKDEEFWSHTSNEKAYSFYTKLGYPSQNMHFHMKYI